MARRRRSRTTESSAVGAADTLPPEAPQVRAVAILQRYYGPGDLRFSMATFDVTGMEPLAEEKPNVRDIAVAQAERFVTEESFKVSE